MANYIFQRNSSPIVNWASGWPPRPTRAADNVSLGGITMVPGGPEMIQGTGGACPCLAGITDFVSANPLVAIGGAAAAWYLFIRKGAR